MNNRRTIKRKTYDDDDEYDPIIYYIEELTENEKRNLRPPNLFARYKVYPVLPEKHGTTVEYFTEFPHNYYDEIIQRGGRKGKKSRRGNKSKKNRKSNRNRRG
jgi:hypothetical protein